MGVLADDDTLLGHHLACVGDLACSKPLVPCLICVPVGFSVLAIGRFDCFVPPADHSGARPDCWKSWVFQLSQVFVTGRHGPRFLDILAPAAGMFDRQHIPCNHQGCVR